MTDLDGRLAAARAALVESSVPNFGDVLSRRRRQVRRRVVASGVALVTFIGGVSVAAFGGDRDRASLQPIETSSPSPSPSKQAQTGDCTYLDGDHSYPCLRMHPASGPVGTRVTFTGFVSKPNIARYAETWAHRPLHFLGTAFPPSRRLGNGCSLIVPATGFHIRLDRATGSVRGSFTVGAHGTCNQAAVPGSPQDGKTYATQLGNYYLVVGCMACPVARFEVTRSPAPDPGQAFAYVYTATFGPQGTGWVVAATRCRGTGRAETCVPTVERSADTGRTWQVVSTLPSTPIGGFPPQVVVPTADDIWVQVGRAEPPYVSHDGGQTFRQTDGGPMTRVSAADGVVWTLNCAAPHHCVVERGSAGDRTVRETPQQPFDRYPNGFGFGPAITAIDSLHAMVAQDGGQAFAITSDGGQSWTRGRTPCEAAWGTATAATDGSIWAVCAGQPGAGNQIKELVHSVDGGNSWRHTDLESYGYADQVVPIDANAAWRVGGRAPVFRTADGGRTWRAFGPFGAGEGPQAFAVSDASTALALWQGHTYETADGGQTWLKGTLRLPPP